MRRERNLFYNTQIRVVGIGGGGSNAVNCMITDGIQGAEFISINTDYQSLAQSKATTRIQIGKQVTQGLGTGGNPGTGRRAVYEAGQEIKNALRGADILFIATCLGGGTGSGASPVVAQIAREMGILTIAIVTRPFRFEGHEPTRIAEQSIEELAKHVDSLIVFPNDRLLSLSNKQTSLIDSFQLADKVLSQGVRIINEFVNRPGLLNVDFADLKSVMANKGATLITVGRAKGANRDRIVAGSVMVCPILGLSIHGAKGMLINITASSSLDLWEVQTITNILRSTIREDADFFLGTVVDEKMGEEIQVTVVATGFSNEIWNMWSHTEQPRQDNRSVFPCAIESILDESDFPSESRNGSGFSLKNFPIPTFFMTFGDKSG